jgi:hypothetical protein
MGGGYGYGCHAENLVANHDPLLHNTEGVDEDMLWLRHGVRFQTEFCTRGCHWIPCMFA